MNFQNYSHYKLPITINPLEYGKLIEQFENKYIVQLNTTNVFVILEKQNENFIKVFKKGELMFEFTDVKISDIKFIRTIQDQRYTFENYKLISTEILNALSSITIYPLYEDTNAITLKNITPLKFNKTYLENTYIFKNYPTFSFISFKLSLILLIYLILFVIFPDNSNITMTVVALSSNLTNKLN